MKTMTTIRTSSYVLFQVMLSYLSRKHVTKSTNFSDDIYTITIYDLDSEQTDKLLSQLIRRIHFLSIAQTAAA